MSIVVNLPAAGAATVPVAGATTAPAPQLSKRALAEWVSFPTMRYKSLTYPRLKKGAMVEVWVECKPFTIQFGGVEKVESRVILCSVHRPLIDHFSPKWKRELAENDKANRVHAPFPKEPVKLIVGWMMAGGGKDLGTAADPYPKFDLRKLEILKSVATHLEIDSLVELITKDIVAATPVLPEAKTKIAPKKEIIRPVRLCYFCQKPG